jgi:hypothetical protein
MTEPKEASSQPQPTRTGFWGSLRLGRSLFWLPTLAAAGWAAVIGLFVSVSVIFDTDPEASWAEGAQAVAGMFFLAWVLVFGLSLLVKVLNRSPKSAKPGWYVVDGVQRYWDGAQWVEQPTSPAASDQDSTR